MQINISLRDGLAQIKPASFLGGDLFGSYLNACRAAGSSYNAVIKANLCAVEAVPLLVEQLRLQGFEPAVAEDVMALLKARSQEQQASIAKAEDRIVAVDAALKARGLALFAFQRTGVQWLAAHRCTLLADDMGLGKTIQAAVAIPNKAPVIVVCPASLKTNWARELSKWRPELTPDIREGRGSFYWPRAGVAVIVNFDILPDDLTKLAQLDAGLFEVKSGIACSPGTVLIIDEAHNLKSKKALRTQRVKALVTEITAKGGYVWPMTGTPLLNRPPELWNLLDLFGLAGKAFGNYGNFCRQFNAHKDGWGTVWGKPSKEVPGLLKKVMLARKREEVLPDLPTKIWKQVPAEIDMDVIRLCDDLLRKMSEHGVEVDGAALRERMNEVSGLQLPGFEDLSRVRAALAQAKIPELLRQVEVFEESEEPVVVFSDFRAPIETLAGRDGWASITGTTPPLRRGEIVEQFQGGRLKGLALTIAAGGVGLTLTRAHQAIFVDRNWTPAINKQAEDRLCRIGQTRGVIITDLVAQHPIDERINEVLVEKQKLIEASVDAARVGETKIKTLAEDLELMQKVAPPAPISRPQNGGYKPSPANGNGPGSSVRTPKRQPATPTEKWAARGLLRVASMDGDRATKENGVGFSKWDNEFAHSLAEQIAGNNGLTDKQWAAACRMANRYRRQIAEPAPAKEAV